MAVATFKAFNHLEGKEDRVKSVFLVVIFQDVQLNVIMHFECIEVDHTYDAKENDWGFPSFLSWEVICVGSYCDGIEMWSCFVHRKLLVPIVGS